MDHDFLRIVLAGAVLSGMASGMAMFIARHWIGLSLLEPVGELPVVLCTAFCQAVLSPWLVAGGLFGLFTLGFFPVWAVFSLAHRNRWELFDGFKFAALQISLLLLFGMIIWILPAVHLA